MLAPNSDNQKVLENVPKVIAAWQKVGLHRLRATWDDLAQGVLANIDDSRKSRIALATQTIEFKKRVGGQISRPILSELSILIKRYQREVEALEKRSKFAEKNYLDVYRLLRDRPDPYLSLKVANEHRQQLQSHGHGLASELADATRAAEQLSQDRDLHLKAESQKVTEWRAEWEAEAKTKHDADLIRTRESLQSQLLNAQTKLDEETAGMQVQLDALLEENERLRMENMALKDRSHSGDGNKRLLEDLRVANKIAEERLSSVEHLTSELSSARQAEALATTQMADLEAVNARLVTDLSQKTNEKPEMHQKSSSSDTAVQNVAKLEMLEKEVRMLRGLVGEKDVTSLHTLLREDKQSNAADSAENEVQIFFKDVIARVQDENTKLKHHTRELTEHLSQARQRIVQAQETSAKDRNLIKRLEDDLTRSSADAAGLKAPPGETTMADAPADGGADGSMVSILTGQRDRLKQQLQKTMAALEATQGRLEQQKLDSAKTEKELVDMVRQVRYLQSYKSSKRPTAKAAASKGGEKLYEESLSPFAAFNQKEKRERYQKVPTLHKMILEVNKMFMGTKFGRLFLFIYSSLLHILVFAMLAFQTRHK